MVLAQKQTQRSVEQNRRIRIEPHNYSLQIFDRRAQHVHLIKGNLLRNDAGKTGYLHEKD
jgi:hypothetical protein